MAKKVTRKSRNRKKKVMVGAIAIVVCLAMVLSIVIALTGGRGGSGGDPQGTVRAYLDAVEAGDGSALDSLVAPESKDQSNLALIYPYFGNEQVKISDAKLKTVSNSGGNAVVLIEDFSVVTPDETIVASSKWGDQKVTFTLKEVDGKWLVRKVTEPSPSLVIMPTGSQ